MRRDFRKFDFGEIEKNFQLKGFSVGNFENQMKGKFDKNFIHFYSYWFLDPKIFICSIFCYNFQEGCKNANVFLQKFPKYKSVFEEDYHFSNFPFEEFEKFALENRETFKKGIKSYPKLYDFIRFIFGPIKVTQVLVESVFNIFNTNLVKKSKEKKEALVELIFNFKNLNVMNLIKDVSVFVNLKKGYEEKRKITYSNRKLLLQSKRTGKTIILKKNKLKQNLNFMQYQKKKVPKKFQSEYKYQESVYSGLCLLTSYGVINPRGLKSGLNSLSASVLTSICFKLNIGTFLQCSIIEKKSKLYYYELLRKFFEKINFFSLKYHQFSDLYGKNLPKRRTRSSETASTDLSFYYNRECCIMNKLSSGFLKEKINGKNVFIFDLEHTGIMFNDFGVDKSNFCENERRLDGDPHCTPYRLCGVVLQTGEIIDTGFLFVGGRSRLSKSVEELVVGKEVLKKITDPRNPSSIEGMEKFFNVLMQKGVGFVGSHYGLTGDFQNLVYPIVRSNRFVVNGINIANDSFISVQIKLREFIKTFDTKFLNRDGIKNMVKKRFPGCDLNHLSNSKDPFFDTIELIFNLLEKYGENLIKEIEKVLKLDDSKRLFQPFYQKKRKRKKYEKEVKNIDIQKLLSGEKNILKEKQKDEIDDIVDNLLSDPNKIMKKKPEKKKRKVTKPVPARVVEGYTPIIKKKIIKPQKKRKIIIDRRESLLVNLNLSQFQNLKVEKNLEEEDESELSSDEILSLNIPIFENLNEESTGKYDF